MDARMLRRIRLERHHPIYAPAFERTLEQPIASAISISPETDIIITEGKLSPPPTTPLATDLRRTRRSLVPRNQQPHTH